MRVHTAEHRIKARSWPTARSCRRARSPSCPASHGPEREIAGAPRRRLRYFSHEQEVRGTGQEETTRFTSPVYQALDGIKDIRFPLHLGQRDAAGPRREILRIGPRLSEYVEVIQRQIKPLLCRAEIPHKCALAGLAGAGDHHDRHNAGGPDEGPGGEARQKFHRKNDNHS